MHWFGPVVLLALSACSNPQLTLDVSQDVDNDGVPVLEDCDDQDPTIGGPTVWYVDLDGDGVVGSPTAAACVAPADALATPEDCDDTDDTVFPGAVEVCNDRDDDCDGAIDLDDEDVDVDSVRDAWPDADGDGFGDADATAVQTCSLGELVDNDSDCDDSNAQANPDALEVCGPADDNCNGVVDDDDPTLDLRTASTFYIDRDGDGYGGAFFPVRACEQPEGTTVEPLDCDDLDVFVSPEGVEVCNGRDDDCDGAVDDDDDSLDLSTAPDWFADADEDGFGDALGEAVRACRAPGTSVANQADCNDADALVNPQATEVCDDIDNDCDTRVDDDDSSLDIATANRFWADRDGDGHGGVWFSLVACDMPDGMSADAADCNDDDATISPSAAEVCDDIDNDCDEAVDDQDADLDLTTASLWFADGDQDGFGSGTDSVSACLPPDGFGTDDQDCRDDRADIFPGATEICNGEDDDCDGAVDDLDDDLTAETASWFRDADDDGFGVDSEWACMNFGFGWAEQLGDCDDSRQDVNPDAEEVCNNRDDNCDGNRDEDAVDSQTFYVDADRDNFGDAPVQACGVASGIAAVDGDCDDTRSDVNPDANEVCDTVDNDCDNVVDFDTPGLPQWFVDADQDGFGVDGTGEPACNAFDGRVRASGDCDDDNDLRSPGQPEVDGDGIDNDCDGVIDIPGPLQGGLLNANTTWGASGNTPGAFTLDINTLVTSGTTLTIEPCTTILMERNATLQIEGELIARGTEDCPIVFTSIASIREGETPAAGDWGRLFFTQTHVPATYDDADTYLSGSILEHVRVQYGGGVGAGIDIAGNGSPFLDQVEVLDSANNGVAFQGRPFIYMRGLTVKNARLALSVTASGGAPRFGRIANSVFADSEVGARINPSASSPIEFVGNIVENNDIGLELQLAPGSLIQGNAFRGNSAYAIRLSPWVNGADIVLRDNAVHHNGQGLIIAGFEAGTRYEHNSFAFNTTMGQGPTNRGGPQTLEDNLFQSDAGDDWALQLPRRLSTAGSAVLTGNTFVGPLDQAIFSVGYAAGSPQLAAENNYWNGATTVSQANAVVLDFLDAPQWAVADIDPILTTPNVNAPISAPTGLEAVWVDDQVLLTWNANPEADLAAYSVYYGLQEHPWNLASIAASEGASGFVVTEEFATLSGLDPSKPWRFALTAHDSDASTSDNPLFEGHESVPTNPVFAEN